MDTPSSSNRQLIGGIVAVTVLIFVGLIWVIMRAPNNGPTNDRQTGKPEAVRFMDDQDPTIGSTNAKVTVHIYGDFQCPACRAAEAGLKPTMAKYADRVRFVWKDFPLAQIHSNALAAANAARCVQVQGWFWRYHDRLYEKQAEWSGDSDPTSKFQTYAMEVEADAAKFNACLTNKTESARVAANVTEGGANRVEATPTFFINNVRYFGMSPEAWSKALDKALQYSGSSNATTTPAS